MKFRIGYRTIKSAIGATAAIMLAQFFELDNFVSAGIIAILCIQATKRKSLEASWKRILSCVTSMVFSIVFFEVFGYHAIVIALILLLFIPTVVMLKSSEGIANNAVIILHFFIEKNVTLSFIGNELAIIFIGIGMALVVNLYMPSVDHKLIDYQKKIEGNFRIIFLEIVRFLREGNLEWDGKEIPETIRLIDEAKSISIQVTENHFLHRDDIYYTYFSMREKQFEIIERVLPTVTSISHIVEQGKMNADFIEELAEHIHGGNTADIFLGKLHKMNEAFKNMALPKTREEFEDRAALLHFTKEMEQYLIIKRAFKGLDDKKKRPGKLAKQEA